MYRAVDLLRHELRVRGGVEISLRKKIPAGRGLGGGSSDAAAALLGYLRLSGKKLEAARWMELAASLGADVPFFLHGGRALGVSKGDEIYPLPDAGKQYLLVVSPCDIHVSTPDAYKWLNTQPLYRKEVRGILRAAAGRKALTNAAEASRIWRFCALCCSVQGTGPLSNFANDFEGPVFLRHPRLKQIKRVLLQNGAAEASLAGSGSAVFGVFRNPAQARRAAHSVSARSDLRLRDDFARQVYPRCFWRTCKVSHSVFPAEMCCPGAMRFLARRVIPLSVLGPIKFLQPFDDCLERARFARRPVQNFHGHG